MDSRAEVRVRWRLRNDLFHGSAGETCVACPGGLETLESIAVRGDRIEYEKPIERCTRQRVDVWRRNTAENVCHVTGRECNNRLNRTGRGAPDGTTARRRRTVATAAAAAATATPLPAVATAVGPFVECVINAFVNTTKHLCVYTAHHLAPFSPPHTHEPTASVTNDDNIPSLCPRGGWGTPRGRHRSRNARSPGNC